MLNKFFIYIIYNFLFINILFCQGEIDEQTVLYIRDEKSVNFTLSSNGFGAGYQFGKRLNYTERKLYGIHISYLKDPKEQRIQSSSGYKFVFGKLNTVFSIRPYYGLQKELFTKKDKGGISIKYFYNYGPSLALLKPIYYKLYSSYIDNEDIYQKFNEDIHLIHDIEKKASFIKGINETKIVPGIHGRFGFNFEYSNLETVIHAIEIGIGAELFIKKIPIMAHEQNSHQFFILLFVNYRLGKMTEPFRSDKKEKLLKYLKLD